MYAFYIIASSQSDAYKKLFSGDYYYDIDTAERELKQFGRQFQCVYEISMPSPIIVVESKKIQLKKEKHNASE